MASIDRAAELGTLTGMCERLRYPAIFDRDESIARILAYIDERERQRKERNAEIDCMLAERREKA